MMLLLIILQLCSLQMIAETKPMCHMLKTVVENAHNYLKDLPFPVDCVEYSANISFPTHTFPAKAASHTQCHRALSLVYETLQGAELVFQEHDLPTGESGLTWNVKKLDSFQNLQYRLLREGRCFSSAESADIFSSYFSNVTAAVQQQETAACGWSILWKDLLRVLKLTLQNYDTCLI